MTAQVLDRVLTAYRIGDPEGRFPIVDAAGSRLFPGRWNTASTPMIYCSEHYSTAMLEKLVHGSGRLPPNQHFVTVTIPNGVSYEIVLPAFVPGWDDLGGGVSRAFGGAWQAAGRSLVLLVPSVMARMERNVLINAAHGEFGRVAWGWASGFGRMSGFVGKEVDSDPADQGLTAG